jgi:hypothetical protein
VAIFSFGSPVQDMDGRLRGYWGEVTFLPSERKPQPAHGGQDELDERGHGELLLVL